jgi:heme exporter protein A
MTEFQCSRFSGAGVDCARGGRLVFAALDFAVEPGCALVLVGPNGSGKSSLLRLMAGLIRPTAGALAWGDEEILKDRESHAGRTHYVGHQEAAKPAMTARETLGFWAAMRGAPGTGVERALEVIGLGHRMDYPGRYLSSGQKRRLALARLLAAPAPLWLLDEPSVGLDRDGVAMLERELAAHCERGGVVVLATHTEIALGSNAVELELGDFTPSREAVLARMAGEVA